MDRTVSAVRAATAVRLNHRPPELVAASAAPAVRAKSRLRPELAVNVAVASAAVDARTVASVTVARTASVVRAVRAKSRLRPELAVNVVAVASAAADARTVASATVARTVSAARAVRAKRRRPLLAARSKSSPTMSVAFGRLQRSPVAK